MKRILGLYKFGSGGHGHHHIKLNTVQNWISNESGKLVCITGFTDLHDHPHHDNTNPYQHLVDAPFSVSRDSIGLIPISMLMKLIPQQINLMAIQQWMMQIFICISKPLTQQNNVELPLYELIFVFAGALGLIVLYGHSNFLYQSRGEQFLQTHITRELLEEEMRKIRDETFELEQRKLKLQENWVKTLDHQNKSYSYNTSTKVRVNNPQITIREFIYIILSLSVFNLNLFKINIILLTNFFYYTSMSILLTQCTQLNVFN